MRSAKPLTMITTCALTAFALVACSSSDTPAPGPSESGTLPAESAAPPAADASIDLRMTVWSSNEDHLALFNSIADEYKADHPEIGTITFDPLPFDDYTSTVTTQIAGNNAPDLAWILENAAPDFVSSGALFPLDEVLSNVEGYEFDDLNDAATALWRQDGALLAYPFSTSPFVVFTNEDLLKEAGQPSGAALLESGRWDWENVSEVGSVVNQTTGKTGFVIRDFEYLNWDYLSTVWNGWGAAPWTEDGAVCKFAEPEMVAAFEFLHDAAFEAKSMPGPGSTADFFAGEAAFTVTQISRANLLADGGFEWDLLPLPEGPAGTYSVTGQAGIGVLARGENPEAAAQFLAHFSNPANSALLAQYFPPPRESLLNTEVLAAANPLLSAEQIENVVIPGIATGQVRPSHTDAARLGQEVRASLDGLWVPNADIPGVLQATCGSIESLLG